MVRVGQKVKTLGSGENGDEGVWKEVRKRRLRLRGMSEYLDKGVVLASLGSESADSERRLGGCGSGSASGTVHGRSAAGPTSDRPPGFRPQ